MRAEAQRQAERILGEARTTSRLIEEERRKNLLEELAQLESEFTRRQEQLASIMKRDRAVRQKISDEVGGLLALVRAADLSSSETASSPSPATVSASIGGFEVGSSSETNSLTSEGVGEELTAVDNGQVSETSPESGFEIESAASQDHRPVQEFVFGHDIAADSTDDEPFMLWRQDD
jgi:cell division septum initiation protein DivIVA